MADEEGEYVTLFQFKQLEKYMTQKFKMFDKTVKEKFE